MWEEAEKKLLNDDILGPTVKQVGPCLIRPSSKSEYFSDLVDAITSQQLSGKAAATIFSRLKAITSETGLTPESLHKLTDEDYKSVGVSRQKAGYLRNLSGRIVSGDLDLASLNKLDDETVKRELIAVKGIGNWTAEMFLMFSLARADVFPIDDLGIQNSLKKLLKTNHLSNERLSGVVERWKPYRTVASWYLWRTLDIK